MSSKSKHKSAQRKHELDVAVEARLDTNEQLRKACFRNTDKPETLKRALVNRKKESEAIIKEALLSKKDANIARMNRKRASLDDRQVTVTPMWCQYFK